MSTRQKPREIVAWAPLPVRARDVPSDLPEGPCVLQGVGPNGAWVTLSRHHTGLAALAERDRRRVWPNRIVPNEQLRAAVTHVWMLPFATSEQQKKAGRLALIRARLKP